MKTPILIATLLLASVFSYAQDRTGTVTGQVLGLDGMPARGIRVALVVVNDAGQVVSDTLISIATTDGSGKYRFDQIGPGRYGVIAGAVDSPTYFPGTAFNTSATPIDVVGGRTVDGVNFKLVTTAPTAGGGFVGPAFRIPGRFISESGSLPIAVAREFMPSFSGFAPVVSSVGALGVGTNRVSTIVNADGTFVVSSYAGAVGVGASGGSSSVNADGSFVISGYSGGEYVVRVDRSPLSRPDNDYYVKSVSFGAIDLLKSPLKATATIQDEIKVTLGTIGSIRGNVQTEDGKPADNIQVYLLPGNSTRAQYAQMSLSGAIGIGNSSGTSSVIPRVIAVATAVTDDQGNFTIRGTAPGDYSIHSEPNGQDGSAPSVRIAIDTIPYLNLTLITGPSVRRLIPTPAR